jgi:hypothetical protein
MSGQTLTFRPAGQTVALSVGATSHAAVAVNFNTPDAANWVSCINAGAVAVAVRFSVAGTAATLPVDGTPGDFLLPAAMQVPITIPLPNAAQGAPCQVTAIGAAAGPTLIYVTPVVMQH